MEANRSIIPQKNGAVKAKEEGRHFNVSHETRKKLAKAILCRTPEFNKLTAEKIAETVNMKVETGTWHTSLAKHMHIDYNGIDLHGSWELKYAQYLDDNGIKWMRNKDKFSYNYGGKNRKYTPDFYLIELDQYVEIKGYKTDKDEAKWSQFPSDKKMIILMAEQLKQLGIL